jgi:hypothetical protein
MSEVHMKLKWIPHYEHVDFVFGIAIAGDLVKMEAIGRHRSIFSDVRALEGMPALWEPWGCTCVPNHPCMLLPTCPPRDAHLLPTYAGVQTAGSGGLHRVRACRP